MNRHRHESHGELRHENQKKTRVLIFDQGRTPSKVCPSSLGVEVDSFFRMLEDTRFGTMPSTIDGLLSRKLSQF